MLAFTGHYEYALAVRAASMLLQGLLSSIGWFVCQWIASRIAAAVRTMWKSLCRTACWVGHTLGDAARATRRGSRRTARWLREAVHRVARSRYRGGRH